MNMLENSREYIKNKKKEINFTNRDKYHFTPSVGWMNDPNGFSYYNGEFHLFYQANPYDIKWGAMYWGHAVSKDLIKFNDLELAMCPDSPSDNKLGCFSGSCIVFQNNLYAIYTGVDENEFQTQNIAVFDGDRFVKSDKNPILKETDLPEGYQIKDFRDPYVIEKNGSFYMFVGSKKVNDGSSILLYKSKDLSNWKFVNVLYERANPKGMMECPCVALFDDIVALIYSPQFENKQGNTMHQNKHSVNYVLGKIDYEQGTFEKISEIDELDKGFDYYAAQVMKYDGKNYIIAWMNMWDRTYPSACDGYVGKMTIVKELELKNNHLYQKLPNQLNKYIKNKTSLFADSETKSLDINLSNNPTIVEFDLKHKGQSKMILKNKDLSTIEITFDKINNLLKIDRSNIKNPIYNDDQSIADIRYCSLEDGDNKIQMIIDTQSIELLVDDGKYSISCNMDEKFTESNLVFNSETTTLSQFIISELE